MIYIKRFINELMASNCYLVIDEKTHHCVCIDPASEKSEKEISYLKSNSLVLDYIFLTHEHTDHTWGVNSLCHNYPLAKIICSEECDKRAPHASRVYFLFYYDNPNYTYVMKPADIVVRERDCVFRWAGHEIELLLTPGHSLGSMCIKIENFLFTGDTIMPFPPYFNKRDSDIKKWEQSLSFIKQKFKNLNVTVLPGHGNQSLLSELLDKYVNTRYVK